MVTFLSNVGPETEVVHSLSQLLVELGLMVAPWLGETGRGKVLLDRFT